MSRSLPVMSESWSVASGALAPEAPAGVALGNNADFVPKEAEAFDIHTVLPPPTTVIAWHARSVGRDILKAHGVNRRMRWCGSKISPRSRGVEIYARPDRAYGRASGVCVCGQSICCPVCAPRIAAFRASEVAEAFKRATAVGWEARLETFTKPHRLDRRPNALRLEIESFGSLWRKFVHHACRREMGAEGHMVARETTWGDSNGWHFHHHRLRFDRPGTFEPSLAKAAWLGALESAGLRSDASEAHAYDCGAVGSEAGARYVSKLALSVEAQGRAIGSEVASAATKGRNINSLLIDAIRGDSEAAAAWLNGVSCITSMKVSSVRWSRGFRAKLGMAVEKSDEEVAREEVTQGEILLGQLSPHQWRAVLKWKAEFALLCAANRGREDVNSFLRGLDCGELQECLPEPARGGKYV